MKYLEYLRDRWIVLLGWALTSAWAFVGAQIDGTSGTIAVWVASAFLLQLAALFLWLKVRTATRRTRKELARMLSDENRTLSAGRAAGIIQFLVIGRDGGLYTGTLRDLIEDRPGGDVRAWEDPYFVRVYYSLDAAAGEFGARAT